jgi:hypothetical protein
MELCKGVKYYYSLVYTSIREYIFSSKVKNDEIFQTIYRVSPKNENY